MYQKVEGDVWKTNSGTFPTFTKNKLDRPNNFSTFGGTVKFDTHFSRPATLKATDTV